MLIKDILSMREADRKKRKSDSASSMKTAGVLFTDILETRREEQSGYENEIEQLKREIDQAGDRLEKEPVIDNFMRFRELLGKLAKRISAEAYQLEKVGGTPHNPRYFEIITVINAEADRLYNLIVMQHKDRMAITAKVIGIKGLVVDLIT